MKLKIVILILLALAVGGGVYLWRNYKGVLPVVLKPGEDITEQIPDTGGENLPDAVNSTDFPLTLPNGFSISILAKDLPGVRDIVQDSFGNLWVSQTASGKITQIEIQNGKVVRKNEIFRNLDRPHGLVLDGTMLYFAEETKVSRVPLYSDGSIEKLADLPQGGRHYTRSLHAASDGRLYVSIGSTCDVCYEKDERIGTIYSMEKDGSDFKQVAKGLRNSVFMATNPIDGKLWATEMGRDNLGDNLPPDEINIIDVIPSGELGASSADSRQNPEDYGWPVCYGKNIHDTDFDKNTYIQNPCNGKIPSHIDLPAHSAPLGLAFVPEEGWPDGLGNDLLVAFHGSWNRSEPTGYKIARVKLDGKGNMQGMEDFISGWLFKDGKTSLGRPVALLALPGGIMYVTDDKAGVVYQVQYLPTMVSSNQEMFKDLNIKENQTVASPLKITGQTRGSWFFEASFPVSIRDASGKILDEKPAQATAEWMTTNFVPFEVTLSFVKPTTPTGWLVFKKDNPSGLPEHDAEYHLPIKF